MPAWLGPGRVVVLVKGAFQEGGADKLDFQARYYALAGSSSVPISTRKSARFIGDCPPFCSEKGGLSPLAEAAALSLSNGNPNASRRA